jgi:IPT/TIG domain
MSLGKRHIGRRVAGVGVAVALMVLGLASPAQAVLGLTGFVPASGPDGCVIVITGLDFLGPDVDVVEVGGTGADFAIQSDTEIWAEAPTGVSGFITVEKTATGESVSSATQFSNTTGSGDCGATIASFTPTCGLVGTAVTITGTNLIQPGTAANSFVGGDVEFSPFTGTPPTDGIDASHTGAAETPTSLTVLVPTGAADGPISVETAVGEVFSTTDFDVVTDATLCVPPTPTAHARSVSFKIKSTGKASGKVSSAEDPAFTDCVASVPVKIQRKTSSGWKTVGKTTTTETGSYTKKVKNPKGKQKFRALAPKVSLGDPVTDTCTKAKSATRKV